VFCYQIAGKHLMAKLDSFKDTLVVSLVAVINATGPRGLGGRRPPSWEQRASHTGVHWKGSYVPCAGVKLVLHGFNAGELVVWRKIK